MRPHQKFKHRRSYSYHPSCTFTPPKALRLAGFSRQCPILICARITATADYVMNPAHRHRLAFTLYVPYSFFTSIFNNKFNNTIECTSKKRFVLWKRHTPLAGQGCGCLHNAWENLKVDEAKPNRMRPQSNINFMNYKCGDKRKGPFLTMETRVWMRKSGVRSGGGGGTQTILNEKRG